MKEVIAREKNEAMIPSVVHSTIFYLDNNGLELEGIFRKSGSASMIQYFKEQFDQGKY